MVIYESSGSDSEVAITFDDGPNPQITPKILEVLKAKNIQATFFLIGKRAEEYPEVVKQIIAEGHDVGNHSYTHKGLAILLKEKGPQAVIEEIQKGSEAIQKVANISSDDLQFFRPPGLNWDNEVGEITKPFYGNRVIMSGVCSGDWNWDQTYTWDQNDTAAIDDQARKIVDDWITNTKAGSVIALHDSAEYGLPGNPPHPNWMNRALPTLQALPLIIDDLVDEGFVIKKLSEMDLTVEPLRTS
jgi:peptidoglycan/xylan/chitin deacetylase (PgdA/CDA1 family)